MPFSLKQNLGKYHAAHLMRQEEDFSISEVCVSLRMLLNVLFNSDIQNKTEFIPPDLIKMISIVPR